MEDPLELLARLTDEDWAGANPLSPEFRDDPYPALHQLREHDPINLSPIGTWRITRYDDVVQVFKHAPTSMTLPDGSNPNFDPLDQRGSFNEFMLNKDGDEHMRLRRLVIKAFTRRALDKIQFEIDEAVASALDRAVQDGGMDAVHDLALYVPSRMICRIMGVPEADRLQFTEWTAARTNAFFARFLPDDVKQRVRDAGSAMADYFDALAEERRKNLGDDLLSELIRAEEDGDRLREGELTVQAVGLLVAGFETTIGLIGNGLRAFIEHPRQMQILRDRPELLDNAVEECLRFDNPILFNWRILTEDHDFGGRTLPRDAVLWPMLGAANRDPARFSNPDRFDITRDDVAHQSFGGGVHFCLGHQLARMEARSAIGTFVRRVETATIDYDELAWSQSFFRVLGKMPVAFA